MEKYTIGIFLFDNVEVLDFAGPFEVFSVAAEISGLNFFEVFTVSVRGEAIKAKNGLKIVPDYSFDNHPPIGLLVVPGGDGTKKALVNMQVVEWIERIHETSFITASICTGSRLLAKTGALDGHTATTHHTAFEELKKIYPKTEWVEGKRFIDNGKVITASGISAGIDMSLYLVEKLFGRSLANKTRRYMEYGDWERL